ncbi:hypothetical protein ABQF34_29330 [Mycolicibacterium boenickei]
MTADANQSFRGSAYVFGNTLCLAVFSVIAHEWLRDVDALLLTFYCFAVVVLATFLLRVIMGRSAADLWRSCVFNWKHVALLNLTTAAYWIAYFIAVKIATAPFANALMLGVAPISALILSGRRRRAEVAYASLILILLGVLSLWYLHQEVSGDWRVLVAITSGGVAGFGVGAAAISMKALAANDMPILDVIALRYWATIVITLGGIYLAGSESPSVATLAADCLRYGWFGLVFILIPAFLVQQGIRLISAFHTCVIASCAPALTYFVTVAVGNGATVVETAAYGLLSLLLARIGTFKDA